MMRLRFRLVRLCLALLLQTVLLELLRVQRLLGTLLLRPAFAPVRTITPVAAATAAAASVTPRTAGLLAFLRRRSRGVLGGSLRTLLLLLRRTRRALIRTAFALRTLGWLALHRRELALLLDLSLRAIGLRPVLPALGTILARLRLLRGTLVPALLVIAPSVAIATRLMIAPAVAVATRLAIASPAAFAAAMILPVARFVARTFRALRPRRSDAGLVRGSRLFRRFFRF